MRIIVRQNVTTMKNLLLLLGVVLFSCQLEEVEDIRDLTQQEQIDLLNQISEPRELNYMINYELDSLPMDSVIVFQAISFTQQSEGSPTGEFSYLIGAYECDTKNIDPEIFRFGLSATDNKEKLNLKNAFEAIVTPHFENKYTVNVIMETDTLFGGFNDRKLCSDTKNYTTPYTGIGDTIKVYGFTKDEADFVVRQLNKFIPQIKEIN